MKVISLGITLWNSLKDKVYESVIDMNNYIPLSCSVGIYSPFKLDPVK